MTNCTISIVTVKLTPFKGEHPLCYRVHLLSSHVIIRYYINQREILQPTLSAFWVRAAQQITASLVRIGLRCALYR